MGSVLQPEELYDELAKRIQAEDGPGTKRVFRQLLDAGRPRQEVVSHISRLIEQRPPDKTHANASEEIRWPKPQSLDGSADTPSLNPEIARAEADPIQRAGTSDELSREPQKTAGSERLENPLSQTAAGEREDAIKGFEEPRGALSSGHIMPPQVGVSSGYADFSVLEHFASKVQFPRELTAPEAKQTVPAEAVPLIDQPRAAHHSARSWSRAPGRFLIGTSITVAAAALLLVWGLYGSGVEEISFVNAHHALTWLQGGRGTKVPSIGNPEKPTEQTGTQQTAVRESDTTTPVTTAPATQDGFAGTADIPTQPNTGATSARGNAEGPSQMEAPPSRAAEQAQLPARTPAPSQQNATDASQRQTAEPQLPSTDTGALLAQGDQFLSHSDITSARLLYERAAEAGDGRGALRMGMTFDPVFLARLRLRGIRTDKYQAIAWYGRASALGNADAEILQRELGNLSRGTGSGSGAIPRLADQHRQPPRVAAHGQRHGYGPRRSGGTAR